MNHCNYLSGNQWQLQHLHESKTYILEAVDRFSRSPLAQTDRKNSKIFKNIHTTHGIVRQIRVNHGTNFMSDDVKKFCPQEGFEWIVSPVNDHRATGRVERTISSPENSVLMYAREENSEPFVKMLERALGALRFSQNATLKLRLFEAHHGREDKTVLENLTKKAVSKKLKLG